MLKLLPFFIGLRYVRAKKRNHFISFISLSSMLGIALGVMVLITVLSVMNGFDEEIHRRFFGIAPEVTVSSFNGKLTLSPALEQSLYAKSEIKSFTPYINTQGLATHAGQVHPLLLVGIDPQQELNVSDINKKLIVGKLEDLGQFNIILGRGLAERLGVDIGDKLTVMIPSASITPAGLTPRFKRFTVKGIFFAGPGFNFDAQMAYIDIHDAQKLMQFGDSISGLKLKLQDVYQADKLATSLKKELGSHYDIGTWTQQLGAFFQAIKLEKTMMFFILTLIIAVAAFNLVSSSVMLVNDKQSEIAILRTIGTPPSQILLIFLVQGLSIAFLGIILGLIAGLVLALNATEIVNYLQALFKVELLSSNIYFVDYLPSKILWADILKVCGTAFMMSLFATLYPAWRASKTPVIEALQHE